MDKRRSVAGPHNAEGFETCARLSRLEAQLHPPHKPCCKAGAAGNKVYWPHKLQPLALTNMCTKWGAFAAHIPHLMSCDGSKPIHAAGCPNVHLEDHV